MISLCADKSRWIPPGYIKTKKHPVGVPFVLAKDCYFNKMRLIVEFY